MNKMTVFSFRYIVILLHIIYSITLLSYVHRFNKNEHYQKH